MNTLEGQRLLTVDEVVRSHVLETLTFYEGNKTAAAESLGITIKTLYTWLHKWGEWSNWCGSGAPMRQKRNMRLEVEL